MNVREAAFLSLERCEKTDKFSNIELDSAIKKHGLTGSDRAFFTTLVYGVIEKRITLDYIIGRFSSKPIEKIEPRLMTILRLGAYQILFLDRTPDSAAVNESVEIAKSHTHKGTASFVNAILRNIVRNKNSLPMPKEDSDEYYSIKYSLPSWLIKLWREDYGQGFKGILEGINLNPPITLRVNTLKNTREELEKELEESGITSYPSKITDSALRLEENTPVSDLSVLKSGKCYVQDEASQLCVKAIGAKAGDTVIDTCSCPGGKSFGIAIEMENKGALYSFDLHESKLSLVKSGAERLGISVISASVQNGTDARAELFGKADKVLCDVPCSGLGVIAKKPDLRHKTPEDISRLPDIQYNILESSASYLKEGGTLVYSTCTLNKKENEQVVTRFLEDHPEFELSAENMPKGQGMVTLFPSEGCDGFFIAKLIKRK